VLVPDYCNIYSREGVSSAEEGVAGWVVFKEFSVKHSFTLESSMCGTVNGHFEESDYENIGAAFCEAIIETFVDTSPSSEKGGDISLSSSTKVFDLAE
jgi:hypothetical protein